MIRVGVLALQGSVIEHMHMLNTIDNVESVEVKSNIDLTEIDGIILPGGESTVMGKLIKDFGLFDTLKSRIVDGMPAWGTCAGMILLAKDIVDEEPHLSVMDIKVRRNAYGRQIDSFSRNAVIPAISPEPIELIFVRAPWIDAAGDNADKLLSIDGHIVAARQNNMLATSFHPELTKNPSVHMYFIDMICKGV
ncbi:MAG TPA: pyridoxal 5'-phosphate synthase glutaminase subunit PdxT [Clostridia bacterium]|nr:pyridoxal 5'-phosphate synthase glutaminase subunit PdxT [Clostridia bacterium]